MFRYIAFVWNVDDPSAVDTSRRLIHQHCGRFRDWQIALQTAGLFVTYAGSRAGSAEPYLLHGESGVVLGKLFERPERGPSTSLPLALNMFRTEAIISSRGRHLITEYWGRYVAFLRDTTGRTSWIVRDPTGGLPCLNLLFGGVRVYFSAMSDVECRELGPFEINWEYLTAWLCMNRGNSHATALRDVYQVLPGECVELDRDDIRRTFYWDAGRIACTNVIEDAGEAVHMLRDRVIDSVRAWGTCYSGVTLSLSGGLDSSIIYAALRDTPAKEKLTCFHYYLTGADMDERRFARLVAESGGSPLIERARSSTVDLQRLMQLNATAEPSMYLYFLEHSRLDAQIAAEHQATAGFTGWGGDQLFYRHNAFLGAGDYLHYRGMRPEFLRVAFDAARMDRLSLWRVVYYAVMHHYARREWSIRDEVLQARPLIRPEVIRECHRSMAYTHPLLCDTPGIPNGKRWHLLQISGAWEFYDPLGREEDPERVSPLYSQPILDVCLRLPVHLLTLGGWDRAIARRAFYPELPRAVSNRTEKGTMNEHLRIILDHNACFVRELLLGGSLVREGVVERKALAATLSGGVANAASSPGEILDLICAEAWSRRWPKTGCRIAA